jgi:hypothetical protein
MIGAWSDFSGTFLVAVGLGAFVLLGVPLLLRPLIWASALRWARPADDDLTVYLGRSLGALICVLSVFAVVAARDAVIQPFFFQITIASFAMTAGVHVWGALRGIQPRTETAETIAWIALAVVGLLCYPGSLSAAG